MKLKEEKEEDDESAKHMIVCSEEDFLFLVDVVQSVTSFMLKIVYWKNWKRNLYLLAGLFVVAYSAFLGIDQYLSDLFVYGIFMYFMVGEKIDDIKEYVKNKIRRKKVGDVKKRPEIRKKKPEGGIEEIGHDSFEEEELMMEDDEEDLEQDSMEEDEGNENPVDGNAQDNKMPDFVEFDNIKDQVRQKTYQINALQKKLQKKNYTRQIELECDQKIVSPHQIVHVKFKFNRGSPTNNDWIGLYRSTSRKKSKSKLIWKWTGGGEEGSIPFKIPNKHGIFEFRYFAGKFSYDCIAKSAPLVVQK